VPSLTVRTVRRLVGVIVGAAALYVSCRDIQLDAFRGVLDRANWLMLAAVGASVVLTVAAVAIRWGAILRLAGVRPSWRALVGAVFIGQASNIVFPLRSGEFARAYVVSLHARRSTTEILGTILIERMADVLAAGFVVAVLLWAGRIPVPVAWSRFALGGLLLAALLGIAVLLSWSRAASLPVVGGLTGRLQRALQPTLACLSQLRRWTAAGSLLGMTAATFGLAASTNYILFRVFGMNVPMLASIVLLIALQVGTVVVSVPGNLGIFQYVTTLVLVAYGVDQQQALAYAWTLYVCTVVPRVGIAALLLLTGYSWPEPPPQA
jgi:uncharacterized protein (TIRG00374 family)